MTKYGSWDWWGLGTGIAPPGPTHIPTPGTPSPYHMLTAVPDTCGSAD